MINQSLFPRHKANPYIRLDTSRCKACWKCVQVCPQGVFGKVDILFHRHALIKRMENCKGCLLCLNSCPNQAILAVEEPTTPLLVKTTMPAHGMHKHTGRRWLNIALVFSLVMTILSLPSGAHAIHASAGIFMLIGCGIHLALHRKWIEAVILQTPKNATPALRRQRRLFWSMFLSGFLCGLSGLVSLPLSHNPHLFLLLYCCATPIHILSGLTFLALIIYHLALHRNWFTAWLGQVQTTVKRLLPTHLT